MSQFYDQASLVMVPSGYKAGKVYSQKPLSTDGELTFTRNSNATRIGPDGKLEKVRQNLALYSNDFSNAAWLKSGSTVTAGYSDPNGGTNAFKVDISAGGNHYLYQGITMPAGTKTVSCWIKADSAISIGFSVGGSTPNAINLTTSWTRFSFVTTDTSGGVFFGNYFGPTPAQEAKTFYVYQSQLEESDFGPTDYIPTTSAAVSVGPTANVPRLNYSNGCPSLLLEPQRTNLVVGSENLGASPHSNLNFTVTHNNTTSPQGYVNADKLAENTANGEHIIYDGQSNAAGTYTLSAFFKQGGGTIYPVLRLNGSTTSSYAGCIFNTSTGTIAQIFNSNYSAPITSVQNMGDGWFRVSMTTTTTDTNYGLRIAASNSTTPTIGSFGAITYTGNASNYFYAWGAQFEAGSYATSYIPTLGASVTRVVEQLDKSAIPSLLPQTSGTLFWDIDYKNLDCTMFLYQLGFSDYVYLEMNSAGTARGGVIESSTSVRRLDFANNYPAGRYKMAFTYATDSFALYVNGTLVGSSTSGTTSAVSLEYLHLNWNGGNFGINQALLFKTRLTNAQLAELTTL